MSEYLHDINPQLDRWIDDNCIELKKSRSTVYAIRAEDIEKKFVDLSKTITEQNKVISTLVEFIETHKRWIPLAQYPFAIMEIDKVIAKHKQPKGDSNEK